MKCIIICYHAYVRQYKERVEEMGMSNLIELYFILYRRKSTNN